MEEINNTSVLEEIEQELNSMNQDDKIHLIGDLACEIYACFGLNPSKKVEEFGERIVREGENMRKDDVIATLKKLINSL